MFKLVVSFVLNILCDIKVYDLYFLERYKYFFYMGVFYGERVSCY